MKIFVKVRAGARENKVDQTDATHYVVSVTAPPVRGKANVMLIALLAEHLKLPKSSLAIKRGANTKQKTIDILTNQILL